MSKQTLAEALAAALEQPSLLLPAPFYQVGASVTPMSKRVYSSRAPCTYYRAAQYRMENFYKYGSRVVTYDQSFTTEEIY